MPSIPFVTQIKDVSSDLVTAVLADITTYSSPARNTLALYAYLYKRDADLNDVEVTLVNDSPLTVTQWSFSLASADGWYVAIVFGFPIWSAGTYAANKCVYYNGSYYKANTSTSQTPGGADWDLITDIKGTVLDLANSGVYITQTNNFSSARSEAGKIGDNLADLGAKIYNGQCKNWEDAASSLYPSALVNSAWTNFRRGDNVEAQKIIDYVLTRYS